MVVTFSSILATGWRARAQEPPPDAGVVPATDAAPPALPPETSAPVQAPENRGPLVEPDGQPPTAPAQAPPPRPAAPAPTGAVAAPAPGEQVEAPAEEQGKGKKKKKKKDKERDREEDHARFGTLEIRGRVYARGEYDRQHVLVLDDMLQPVQRTIESFDLSVPQARLSFQYRSPMEWLTAVAEIDISGRPEMKDGYVQAKDKHFSVRAGQFKVPIAAVQATSPWTLPFVRRGLIHNTLVDRMDYGGRRPGVTVGYRNSDVALHPKLTLGAFQGSFLVDTPTLLERDTDLLNAQKLMSQSFVARAEIEVAGAEVGAYYENRIGSPALFQTYRYWVTGADFTYDHVFSNGGLRMWIDGMVGSSWYEQASKVPDGKDAIFTVARALIAYRFGGITDEAFYVEPYTHLGVLDPDVQVTSDLLWEAVVGVNVGYWKRARLSLQGEINKGQRNVPVAMFAGPPPDRVGLILQAGVAF